MTEATVILEIGAEGGSIKVIQRIDADGAPQFSVQLRDQSYMFLSDGEGGGTIRKDSAWTTSWEDVIKTLGKWPWADLHALYVHPDFRKRVCSDVEQYKRYGEPARASAIERWSKVCEPGAAPLRRSDSRSGME